MASWPHVPIDPFKKKEKREERRTVCVLLPACCILGVTFATCTYVCGVILYTSPGATAPILGMNVHDLVLGQVLRGPVVSYHLVLYSVDLEY